jgi:hypothetical protein
VLTKRDELQPWIKDYLQPRYPELVGPLLVAADAFDRTRRHGTLSPEDARFLFEAASSARSPLGENSASMLGELARDCHLARDTILRMSKDRKAHVRVNALVSLDGLEPCDVHDTVARAALCDFSARVRELAADKVRGWNMTHLLPELESAIQREANGKLRSTLERQRDLLRNGYRVEARDNDTLWITFQGPGEGLISTSVSGEEWRTLGLAAIARRLGVRLAPMRTELP